MKRAGLWFVGLTLVGGLFGGCTPSPDRVCDHMVELRADGRPVPEDRRARWRAECMTAMTRAKDGDSSGYRTAARCIMGLSGSGQRRAFEACVAPIESYWHNARPAPPVGMPGVGAPPGGSGGPVLNPAMDPRTVEPCVAEMQGQEPGTPAYNAAFQACTQRRAMEINAQQGAR